MRLSAYDTFSLYLALKNHFTQEKYDFHKYHGKTRISKESFLSRKDKFQFQKLCRKYDENEMTDFLIANLLQNKKWVGEMLEESAHDFYLAYVKYKQGITYHFDNELSKLFQNDPETLFVIKNNQYPPILNHYLSNDISLQTLTILNHYIHFSDKFDEKLGKDDILWSKIRLLCFKLTPFLDYDKVKIKNILKERLNESRFSIQKQKEGLQKIPETASY